MGLKSEMFHRGGIATAAQLRGAGVSPRRLNRAVDRGEVSRVRRGWYASLEAPEVVRRAVEAGGALTCTSALALMGVWTMPDATLHVRIGRGSHPSIGPHRVHWSRDPVDAPVDSPLMSIRQLLTCADTRSTIIALDSVLNSHLVTTAGLTQTLSASARGRRLIGLLDGRSESGLETIARLGLRRCRIEFRPQAVIAGIGRVDFLIGDRLVLEVDGRRWHDFDDDRARDRALITAGYLVIRASYTQVMNGWPAIEAQILQLVRRREHLWRASHRSLGHAPRTYRG